MVEQVNADIVIFGGGIAGLWTLTRLRQAGFVAVLFETETLGCGQTIKSQGIIHGGMKYALQGVLTKEASAMAEMPNVWRACLAGQGEVDLSSVGVLSKAHYLWSTNRIAAKIAGFFAGAALSSKVAAVDKANFPPVFSHAKFKGDLYALDEIVLDVPSVVQALADLNRGAIFKIRALNSSDLQFDASGNFASATVSLGQVTAVVKSRHAIFAAGAGNDIALNALKTSSMAMQLRPLHMVMVKTPFYYSLYAHCMGLGPRPRITITTHRLANGEAVWYLGGLLAEEGVARDEAAQIQAAKKELKNLFPWLDFERAQYATLRVDRAEPQQESGLKPDNAYVNTVNNVTIAWPTKLALAPQLAQTILSLANTWETLPEENNLEALRDWPQPPVAKPMWETCTWKSE